MIATRSKTDNPSQLLPQYRYRMKVQYAMFLTHSIAELMLLSNILIVIKYKNNV